MDYEAAWTKQYTLCTLIRLQPVTRIFVIYNLLFHLVNAIQE